MTEQEFNVILKEANEAAEKASCEWLAHATSAGPKYAVYSSFSIDDNGVEVGTMLDVCGNAHITVKDKRTVFSKLLNKYYMKVDPWQAKRSNQTVLIDYSNKYRQEYGLHVAAAKAALEVLTKHGVKGLKLWTYID